jgi:LysR substrate binding domain
MPSVIRAYRQLHPGVSILLEVGNRATVFERLKSRRADIGIGGRPPGRSLIGLPLVGNELVVVGREIPSDLARTPWLLREEGSGTRLATERLLADLGLGSAETGSPELLTLGSNGAIKQGLEVGLGITLISRFAVARELQDGMLSEISVPVCVASRMTSASALPCRTIRSPPRERRLSRRSARDSSRKRARFGAADISLASTANRGTTRSACSHAVARAGVSRTRRSRVNNTIAVLMASSLRCFRLVANAARRVGPPRAPDGPLPGTRGGVVMPVRTPSRGGAHPTARAAPAAG